jgi:hypothetical protein
MTHFSQSQLCHLYAHFGLAALAAGVGTTIPIFISHTYYRIHPEEVFLFILTKLATGLSNHMIVDTYFGGDYNRWTYGYPWMLRYLDKRYKHIAGHQHQGLTHFVDKFPWFHRAIEEYVQRDHLRELVDGTMTIVPSIDFMLWDIFAFIDDSINRVPPPFLGRTGTTRELRVGQNMPMHSRHFTQVKSRRTESRLRQSFSRMGSAPFLVLCLLDVPTPALRPCQI